jgi:hypothetical protein
MKKIFGSDHWSYKHGGACGESGTREYRAYIAAKQRCTNSRTDVYKYYGGRGIEFRFASYNDFFKELGRRPSAQHSLERIDNSRHYEPGNVRWATRTEQQNNVRRNLLLTANGETHTQAEWARLTGFSVSTLIHRRKQGWCDVCVITLPNKPGVKQSCLCSKNTVENE